MSEAMCCPLSGGSDYDAPEAFTTARVIARKDHRCCECHGVIPKGDSYQKDSGIWAGLPDCYETCLLCAEIRKHFACDGGWVYELLWEDLEDNFFPDMKAGGPCMEGLSPSAKQFLIDKRMEWYLDESQEHDGAPPPQVSP